MTAATVRLCDIAAINPPSPSFISAGPHDEVMFVRMEGVWPDGLRFESRCKAEVESGFTRFESGDLLVPKITPTFSHGRATIATGLEGRPGVGTTELHVLRPNRQTDVRWLAYITRADHFVRAGEATLFGVAGQKRIDTRWLRSFRVPAIALAEQRLIADFLDRETAQIDELVSEQEGLIEALRERRAAIVDHAVWRGVDDVELAPTGIEPVPLAPAHWRRARNKELLVESVELSVDGSEELLSVSHLTGISPRSEKHVTMIEAESLDGYRIVHSGDLVINTMWAWMGALGVSNVNGIVSPAYGVYRPRPAADFEPAYFNHLYRSTAYVAEMTRWSRGIWSSRLRIYPEVFLRLSTVVPPLDEQRAIANYLDEQTTKIDALIAEAEAFIELAKERRSALITAAVTGQLEIQGAAA